ncbi:DUF4168 domain-containing protein [Phormidium yuhuli AB48]|uniref:DUF4168 domain-containing protein n=1 Tax=Phormidium yuhuli AB48 TaxID=2940671 RepID=A0ABY5AKE4_9CYAN|nr:DUF4168 domain-containing protein [Phormidium yuhuli]USR89320.1 DUF4168 domain-containing protein [Phormidium yuhuli AB48]
MVPRLSVSSIILSATSITLLTLLSGCGGNASNGNTPEVGTEAPSETWLDAYATSLSQIEQQRQASAREILDNVPENERPALQEVRCDQPESVRGFSRNLRRGLVNYCDRVAEIIEAQNMTVEEFNEMRDRIRQDPLLENQVMQRLVQLQQQQEG